MMRPKVKVFIKSVGGNQTTGDSFDRDIAKWQEDNPTYEITSLSTNSNKYAWMIAITYVDTKEN